MLLKHLRSRIQGSGHATVEDGEIRAGDSVRSDTITNEF